MNITDRFKDAPWFAESYKEKILLAGVGGIGSNALYYLAKTIPASYYIFDNDTVESHNIGTQFFSIKDKGDLKVKALKNNINLFCGNSIFVQPFPFKIKDDYMPISIAAFDNMEARKQLFDTWKRQESREIFIDGRLSANVYQIFVVIKGREEWYEATLFDDTVVESAPCTFKQTAYVAGLIGARITHVVVNYLSNKYMNDDVFNLPYFIEESTELFNVKISYDTNI